MIKEVYRINLEISGYGVSPKNKIGDKIIKIVGNKYYLYPNGVTVKLSNLTVKELEEILSLIK
ncbi:hypothetical protein KAS41_03020 [Candidatus Parcubacteria bacterium]|nr:hypothetical protein [Candidatus Parcubacteria bacterium]